MHTRGGEGRGLLPTCVDRVGSIIERERELGAEAKRLDNYAEELASRQEGLEMWSEDLHDIEADLRAREERAARKESFLRRAFRRR